MKNILYTVLALGVMFSLMACPDRSNVPLDDKPTEKINKKYLGTYKTQGWLWIVKKKNAYQYKITRTKVLTKDYKKVLFGYTTTINGQTFLQTQESEKNSAAGKEYYIYRLAKSDSDKYIVLQPFKKDFINKFKNAAAFKSFIEHHSDVNSLFPKDEKFYIYK